MFNVSYLTSLCQYRTCMLICSWNQESGSKFCCQTLFDVVPFPTSCLPLFSLFFLYLVMNPALELHPLPLLLLVVVILVASTSRRRNAKKPWSWNDCVSDWITDKEKKRGILLMNRDPPSLFLETREASSSQLKCNDTLCLLSLEFLLSTKRKEDDLSVTLIWLP